ncbi:hypothetical protein [Paraburkholderia atlantica]|uniref:hypothetical protein n=1 Tax=Paraburkholderia atlantica TaxID=2654982 RepID=UPI001C85212B|nr:hypothetical protein [Paraburkholderia atlantica]
MNRTLRWEKQRMIFCPPETGGHPKLRSHAANPLPLQLDGDVYRIFYSGRDEQNRSSVGAVDVDIVRREIVATHREPFLIHGPAGSFYAAGVSIGNCYVANGIRYMLFMGWQNPEGGHWRGDIGRVPVTDDLMLDESRVEMLMGSDACDPVSLSYPWVMDAEGGGLQMWYGSTVTWNAGNGEMLHVFNYATSDDGDQWVRHGQVVPHQLGAAQAFSRPTVCLHPQGGYEMWFSYRSGSGTLYQIGYAKSADGKNWVLALDEVGIEPSPQGWDANMIEYPYVFDHKNERYMLYNGDRFGATGFGLAILRRD